jgi:hypothetical protein
MRNYQGAVFEELCHELFLSDRFQKQLRLPFDVWEYGRHWDGKTALEIDIAAYDKKKSSVFIAECKLNPNRITPQFIREFKIKTEHQVFKQFPSIHRGIITLTKVNSSQHRRCVEEGIQCVSLQDKIL